MLIDWQSQHNQNVHIVKGNLRIQCNPSQNPNMLLRNGKEDARINLETQETANSSYLKNKTKRGGIAVSDVKTNYREVVNKTVWNWYRNRQEENETKHKLLKRDRTCSATQSQTKELKIIQEKGSVSSTNAVGIIGYLFAKVRNKVPHLSLHAKINSQWVTDRNMHPDAIKLPEKTQRTLYKSGRGIKTKIKEPTLNEEASVQQGKLSTK